MGYSAFLVSIISAETRTERSCGLAQSYVVYTVKVVNGDTSWVCEKRYSDFLVLNEVLRSKFWSMSVPKLPGKKLFFNFDDDFVNKRREALQDWMRGILKVACFSQSDELWQFLTDSRSIVGVPPEIREENDNFKQAIPVGGDP